MKKNRYNKNYFFPWWIGMTTIPHLRLLVKNRFAFSPKPLILFKELLFLLFSLFINTPLAFIKEVLFRNKIRNFHISKDPIFIIGHWRTGSTLLHELLALDPNHSCPNNFQCFAASHFLLTESFLPRMFPFLLPATRPMDNMKMAMELPQECDFALPNLGLPGPYLTVAFPNNGPQYSNYFDLENIGERKLKSWKKKYYRFLKEVNFKKPGRLVLKSPPHSFRIKILLELFPNAKFIHIYRNPFTVFPSTIHLWKSHYKKFAYQVPNFKGLEEYVFDNFVHLYQKIEDGKKRLSSEQYYELNYESLIKDPCEEIKKLYGALNLGNFEGVAPFIKAYFKERKNYKTNIYSLPPETVQKIASKWGPIIKKYGYSFPDTAC